MAGPLYGADLSKEAAMVARFADYGGIDQISVEEVPRPTPGDDQVLVQVVASGVSQMDAYIREGRFQDATPITVPARQGK